MNKVWIFFKLRMVQLRYDKTALFFSYFLPIILLTGIGYPIEMAGNKSIDVHLYDQLNNSVSKSLIDYLHDHHLVKLVAHLDYPEDFKSSIKANRFNHFIMIKSVDTTSSAKEIPAFSDKNIKVVLYSDDANTHKVQSLAIGNILNHYFYSEKKSVVVEKYLSAGTIGSYIVTLLPGLIGMTLLTVGLNGFGGVLIVEYNGGLFRNIKTMDASPIPFLAGLFLSRLFISYTVAAALYIVGVLMFGLSTNVDFLLLLVVVTLGCISFLGIGLVIAVFSKSVSAFNGIVNFVNIPFVVFSGVFFSTAAFPDWLQIGTQVIPLTHMNMAVKAILFEGVDIAHLGQISKELIVLSLWCFATVLLGVKKFKW